MLPAPNLDDRIFQDLVDDAKRLVQQRCPTWTDHNVSDPGVTLIEAVAQMIDQLIYRLNRVPDLNYIKFLELIGVELRPPAAARGQTTFWLSAPQPQTVRVRAESQVATPRTDISEPVVFSTTRELAIIPCEFAHAATQSNQSPPADTTMALGRGGFRAFSASPMIGDALLIGLSEAVPSCAVLLRLDCKVSGRGVDPRRPPIIWEAWTDSGWAACDLDSDETGGLNKPGDVILHVPDNHQTSVIAKERAGWLRCRLIEAPPDVPTYVESPTVINDRGAHDRRNCADGQRRGCARRDPGAFGRYAGPAIRLAASPCRRLRRAADPDCPGWRGGADLERGAALCALRSRRSALPHRRVRRRALFRAGAAHWSAEVCNATARSRRPGAVLRLESYRTGGGQARQRRPRPGAGAEDEHPVRVPGREPSRRPSAAPRPRRSMMPRRGDRCCCARAVGR